VNSLATGASDFDAREDEEMKVSALFTLVNFDVSIAVNASDEVSPSSLSTLSTLMRSRNLWFRPSSS
jgi:hypothetical protein